MCKKGQMTHKWCKSKCNNNSPMNKFVKSQLAKKRRRLCKDIGSAKSDLRFYVKGVIDICLYIYGGYVLCEI